MRHRTEFQQNLTICGRVIDDTTIFRLVFRAARSTWASWGELRERYQTCGGHRHQGSSFRFQTCCSVWNDDEWKATGVKHWGQIWNFSPLYK